MYDITTPEAVTMTSLEMVEYINSQRGEGEAVLRHRDFMVKVPKVLGEGVCEIFRTPYTNPQNGQTYSIYRFPKREACLMAMSYSYELQAKVFDRMTALETEARAKSAALPLRPTTLFPEFYSIAKLIGCDNNTAAISANQAVLKKTGENLLELMDLAQLPSPKQTIYFKVSDLADGVSGQAMNKLLAAVGLQHKDGERWVPDDGGECSRILDTGKRKGDGTPVQQVKWSKDVLKVLNLA